MIAHDDVRRLQVAVNDPSGVRVVDGVADVGETPQQLAQLQRPAAWVGHERLVLVKPRDRHLERIALDEPHGVVGPALGIHAQAVDGNDAGVFQPAGDLGLGDEPLAADGVVGVLLQYLLHRHLAMQLVIQRHEHGAQTAPRVRPEDAEPLAVGGRRAHSHAGCAVGVVVFSVGGRAVLAPRNAGERGLDLGHAESGQAGAGSAVGGHRGKALLHVAVFLDVQGDDGVEAGAGIGVKVAPADEVVGQGRQLVAGPGLEGRDQGALVDQTVLKREQSEEQMAVSGGGHGEAPRHDAISNRTDHGHRAPVAR